MSRSRAHEPRSGKSWTKTFCCVSGTTRPSTPIDRAVAVGTSFEIVMRFHGQVDDQCLILALEINRATMRIGRIMRRMSPAELAQTKAWWVCEEDHRIKVTGETVQLSCSTLSECILSDSRLNSVRDTACYSCDGPHCDRRAVDVRLFPCGRCSTPFYCSVECQSAAWPAHRRWCREDTMAGDIVSIDELDDQHIIFPSMLDTPGFVKADADGYWRGPWIAWEWSRDEDHGPDESWVVVRWASARPVGAGADPTNMIMTRQSRRYDRDGLVPDKEARWIRFCAPVGAPGSRYEDLWRQMNE